MEQSMKEGFMKTIQFKNFLFEQMVKQRFEESTHGISNLKNNTHEEKQTYKENMERLNKYLEEKFVRNLMLENNYGDTDQSPLTGTTAQVAKKTIIYIGNKK